MKKIISFLLLLTLLASFPASAINYTGLGMVYYTQNDLIAPGLTYQSFYSKTDTDVKQKSFVFEYVPGNGTLPVVRYNDSVYGKATLNAMLKKSLEQGEDVVAAMNGDFFSFQTGIPMSLLIENGELLSTCDNRNAIGFKGDASVIIGNPQTGVTLFTPTHTLKISHFNKYPSPYGVYLLSEKYGETTKSTTESTEIVIAITDGVPALDNTVTGVIQEIRTNAMDTPIPPNHLVLSVNNKSTVFADFQNFVVGESVNFHFSASSEWKNVNCAIGGGDILLDNSVIPEGIADEDHEKVANPRTAVGVTADNRVIFFAVDGRQSNYSNGLTLIQLANVMKELGCVRALNLDGGGSTTVAVRTSDKTVITMANKPTEGSQRPISNAILFLNTLQATGIPSNFVLSPANPCVLKSGGIVDFNVLLRDTACKQIAKDVDKSTLSYKMSYDSMGTIANNRFTAGEVTGNLMVTVTGNVDGHSVTGTTALSIVNSLTDFTIHPRMRTRIPTAEKMNFGVDGASNGLYTYVSPKQLTWSFKENPITTDDPTILAASNIGYIDSKGVFYAVETNEERSNVLLVNYGYKTVSIPLTVGVKSDLLYDFGDGTPLEKTFYTDETTKLTYVDTGRDASKGVQLTGNAATFLEPQKIYADAKTVELWVKSAEAIDPAYMGITDANDEKYDLAYDTVFDSSARNGWKLLRVVIPETLAKPIRIRTLFHMQAAHPVILDNMTVYYADKGAIFNDTIGHWAEKEMDSLYYLGIANGEIAENNRYYYPNRNLTRQEFAKMLAGYQNLDLANYKDTPLAFSDSDAIAPWAIPYVKAVVGAGLMSGKGMPDDTVAFCPKENITRVEVMYVIGSLLGDADSGQELTFADTADIAEWAIQNVQKTVAAKIIAGYADNTLLPKNLITRAEIAAIFARMA